MYNAHQIFHCSLQYLYIDYHIRVRLALHALVQLENLSITCFVNCQAFVLGSPQYTLIHMYIFIRIYLFGGFTSRSTLYRSYDDG